MKEMAKASKIARNEVEDELEIAIMNDLQAKKEFNLRYTKLDPRTSKMANLPFKKEGWEEHDEANNQRQDHQARLRQ